VRRALSIRLLKNPRFVSEHRFSDAELPQSLQRLQAPPCRLTYQQRY
jgi:hypothetical protein